MGRRDPLPSDALVGVHVLVVDDDPDAGDLMRTVLQYCGALVTVVASASEALKTLQRVTPDLILSDISMPERDGYWLIRQIRGLPPEQGGAIPAIAVTAFGSTHGPDRTLSAGFQAHVRKPIDPWELCRVLAGFARKPPL